MTASEDRAATGIAGLDDILGGGFTPDRVYLVEGNPGRRQDDARAAVPARGRAARRARPLRHAVRDRRTSCARSRASHGWSLDGDRALRAGRRPRAELDADAAAEPVPPVRGRAGRDDAGHPRARSSAAQPTRVVLRLALRDAAARPEPAALPPADPRAQAVLRRARVHRAAARRPDLRGRTTCSSTASPTAWCGWSSSSPEYGAERRRLRVDQDPRRGGSAAATTTSSSRPAGMRGLPAPGRGRAPARRSRARPCSSGIAELDALLGGGLERGTSTLLIGPAGAASRCSRLQYARAAAERGERAALFIFDEELGPPARARRRDSAWTSRRTSRPAASPLQQVDPAELSPGEFAHRVRDRGRAGRRRAWS